MTTVQNSLRDHIREAKTEKHANQTRWHQILTHGIHLGVCAGRTALPEPMDVYTPNSLLDNSRRPNTPVYHVPDGVCGFAWVQMSAVKGTEGQEARKFINWLTGTQAPCDAWLAPPVRCDKSYGGGHSIWISDHNQSMQRKSAHADALSAYLRENIAGLSAYTSTRID